MDPAREPLARDVNAHERLEGLLVDAVVAVAHDRAVDIPRDDQDQRVGRLPEGPLDPGGIEQAEGDVQRLAEASVGVVVDFSRVHDDPDPQLPLGWLCGKAGVVLGEEPAEQGDDAVQQERLGRLVNRVDEGQDAVTPVDEPVAMALVDACLAQRRFEQLVGLVPQLALDGIRAAGGTLDIQCHDGTVMRQASAWSGSISGLLAGARSATDVATTVRSGPAGRARAWGTSFLPVGSYWARRPRAGIRSDGDRKPVPVPAGYAGTTGPMRYRLGRHRGSDGGPSGSREGTAVPWWSSLLLR